MDKVLDSYFSNISIPEANIHYMDNQENTSREGEIRNIQGSSGDNNQASRARPLVNEAFQGGANLARRINLKNL
jgi:hypothetical protein